MSQLTDNFSAAILSHGPLIWPIRTKSESPSLSASIEREIRAASGGLPVARVMPMTELQADSTARQHFNLMLLTIFAAIAVLLVATGIYGVMTYAVEERTKEIGIRVALGAPAGRVRRTLVLEGMRLALVGVALGLLGSLALMPLMKSLLFKVEPTDPAMLVTTSIFLTTVALVATYIPARRATRIDPLQALRWE